MSNETNIAIPITTDQLQEADLLIRQATKYNELLPTGFINQDKYHLIEARRQKLQTDPHRLIVAVAFGGDQSRQGTIDNLVSPRIIAHTGHILGLLAAYSYSHYLKRPDFRSHIWLGTQGLAAVSTSHYDIKPLHIPGQDTKEAMDDVPMTPADYNAYDLASRLGQEEIWRVGNAAFFRHYFQKGTPLAGQPAIVGLKVYDRPALDLFNWALKQVYHDWLDAHGNGIIDR